MNNITPSTENYLETMLLIEQEGDDIRVKDISRRLNVSMPSVNAAVRNLNQKKLVKSVPYGAIELTPSGRRIAAAVYHKHKTLSEFLQFLLAVPFETANEEACQLEHYISSITVQRLALFLEYFEKEQFCQETEWFIRFQEICQEHGLQYPEQLIKPAAHPNLNK